jgi:GcrA cell cycle regulator
MRRDEFMTTETVSDGSLYVKPPSTSVWTDELIDKVKLLWETNSASEIASLLWRQDGISLTRNAIVGKLHRLHLTVNDKRVLHTQTRAKPGYGHEAKPQRTAVNVNVVNAARARPAPLPLIVSEPANPKHITFAQTSDLTCKFPYGNGAASTFTFCGAAIVPGKPWCSTHCAEAYEPAKPRKAIPFYRER